MLKACPLLGVGWVGCITPLKFPNLQKKSCKSMFARQASLKNLKFYIFLDRKIDQISGEGPLLSDLHHLRPKNSRIFGEMPTFIKSGRDPLLKNLHPPQKKKSLVWAWLKPVKCIGLGSRVGLRGLSPLNIFRGAGVSFSPRKSYILIL